MHAIFGAIENYKVYTRHIASVTQKIFNKTKKEIILKVK